MATIDLEKYAAAYREKEARIKRRIILCGGTGCVANGSLKIREALSKLLTENGIDVELDIEHEAAEQVKYGATYVSKSGCQGFCQMGPLMRIEPDGIMYVKVKEEDVPEIVGKTILNGEVIDRLTYVNPADQKHYAKEEEIPFYAKQHRVVMKNCTIEPNSIGEYVAKRGYEGAKKAYTQMT